MNIEVRMIQMKGAFHAFATTGTQAPETKQILLENIEFIKTKFCLSRENMINRDKNNNVNAKFCYEVPICQ